MALRYFSSNKQFSSKEGVFFGKALGKPNIASNAERRSSTTLHRAWRRRKSQVDQDQEFCTQAYNFLTETWAEVMETQAGKQGLLVSNYIGAGMVEGLDNPAESPLGDAFPRHILDRIKSSQKKKGSLVSSTNIICV